MPSNKNVILCRRKCNVHPYNLNVPLVSLSWNCLIYLWKKATKHFMSILKKFYYVKCILYSDKWSFTVNRISILIKTNNPIFIILMIFSWRKSILSNKWFDILYLEHTAVIPTLDMIIIYQALFNLSKLHCCEDRLYGKASIHTKSCNIDATSITSSWYNGLCIKSFCEEKVL